MKTKNFKISVILFALIVSFVSCNKDVPVAEQQDDPTLSFLIAGDSTTIVDVALNEDTLKEYTDVMDIKDDFLKYVYDRSGLLSDIYYCKRDITTTSAEVESVAYMVDRFTYNNTGRLDVLARYRLDVNTVEPVLKRSYIYDDSGKLVEIVIEQPTGVAPTHELLFYDNVGNMVKKLIKGSKTYYTFEYDKKYLRKISQFEGEILKLICLLYYDINGNVQAVEFLSPTAVSTSGVVAYKRSTVKFEHDGNPNPFKDLKLPALSLIKWMDGISTNNITKILTGEKEVIFKYEYNTVRYPILRYRVQ